MRIGKKFPIRKRKEVIKMLKSEFYKKHIKETEDDVMRLALRIGLSKIEGYEKEFPTSEEFNAVLHPTKKKGIINNKRKEVQKK